MKEKIKKSIIYVFMRVVTILLLSGWIISSFAHLDEALTAARLKTLNRVMPPMTYIMEINRKQTHVDEDKMHKYLHYYNTVDEYLPDSSDVYDLLGYVLARLGNKEEAMMYYKKSVELNPYFFWSQYNLGMLYLHQHNYAEAATHFKKALQSSPEATLAVFASSKVYQQLFLQLEDPVTRIQDGIAGGYKDAYRLLILTKQWAQSSNPSSVSFDFNNAPLFIF